MQDDEQMFEFFLEAASDKPTSTTRMTSRKNSNVMRLREITEAFHALLWRGLEGLTHVHFYTMFIFITSNEMNEITDGNADNAAKGSTFSSQTHTDLIKYFNTL